MKLEDCTKEELLEMLDVLVGSTALRPEYLPEERDAVTNDAAGEAF